MKINVYVLGSSRFMKEMVETKDKLRELGFDGWIHPDYEAFVRGEKQDIIKRAYNGEHAAVKRENDYLRQHYKHILQSGVILFVNSEKNGIKNYIGGNVLIEMGQAYVNNKKIFFLHGMPTDLPYMDEIECMDPICLNGDLNNLAQYVAELDNKNTISKKRPAKAKAARPKQKTRRLHKKK